MFPTKLVLTGANGSVITLDDFDMSDTTLATIVMSSASGDVTLFPGAPANPVAPVVLLAGQSVSVSAA